MQMKLESVCLDSQLKKLFILFRGGWGGWLYFFFFACFFFFFFFFLLMRDLFIFFVYLQNYLLIKNEIKKKKLIPGKRKAKVADARRQSLTIR